MSGEVHQGSYLRLERLANELDISATPVREAMAALEREGLVRLEPRRGYVVSHFSRQDIADVFMVEAFIASELAARAAERVGPERLAELQQVYDELKRLVASEEYEAADDANFRFYWLVHDAAKSPRLTWLVSTIVPYSPHGYTSIDEARQNILEGHGSVLDALFAHDPVAARRSMNYYVQRFGEHVVRQFEHAGLWDDVTEAPEPTE
jgi:DNA-binding GntR family transcriptional regulator